MIAVLLASALLLCCSYICWNCTFWQRQGVKGPCGFPIFGNMFAFFTGRKHYGEVYQKIYNSHPQLPYIGIYRLFNEPVILLRNLDMVKEVMIRSFQHFQDNVLWVNPERDPIMWCNPFIAKGEKWKNMRAEILPIFTPNKVKASFPHIKAISRKLQEYVEKNLGASFEAKDLFSKYTIDVVASAAYGLDAESLTKTNSEFAELVENLFLPNPMSLVETIALLFSPTLGNIIKFHYVPVRVQKWLSKIINTVLDTRINGATCTATSSDFIQWLLEAKQKSNESIDALTIVGHCGTFLFEGFETSSSLMAFTLFEYARNPIVQSRVLQEIDDVLRRHDNDISYAALQEMVYFEASLFESLRMHPPMQALLKHCTKPFQLPAQASGGKVCAIEEGTVFVVPVRAIHYDPDLYPEPTAYKPERFTETSERQKLSCAFLGFGEGPRMCPGMRFGLAQTKAGLVSLLANYSVHFSHRSKNSVELAPTTFLTVAKHGIWINFKKRLK